MVGIFPNNAAVMRLVGAVLLDMHDEWISFEWIEAFYNPTRRHSALGHHSPLQFETLHTAAHHAA